MTIRNGIVIRELQIVSPKDVIDSKTVQELPYHAEEDYFAVGSGYTAHQRKLLPRNHKGKKIPFGAKAYVAGLIPWDKKKTAKEEEENDSILADFAKDAALYGIDALSPRLGALVKTFGPTVWKLIQKWRGKGWSENKIYDELIGMGYGVGGSKGGKKMTQAELKKYMSR